MHTLSFIGGGVRVDVDGQVDADVLVCAVLDMAADPRFSPSIPAVWNLAGARGIGSLRVADLHQIADRIAHVRRGGEWPRVAIVVPGDVEYGVARMYEGLNADVITVRLRVFRRLDEAEAWAFGGETREEMARGRG